MKEIDLYDFDKTLLPFDSTTRFIFYCLLRYPWCLVPILISGLAIIPAFLGIISFTDFKKVGFSFMMFIPRERAVKRFWDKYEKSLYPWARELKRPSVIISASPDFLLEEIYARLDFEMLICSRHNAKTGAIIGENCSCREKVRRLYEEYDRKAIRVVDVYSDSLGKDWPIFALAEGECYHITKNKKTPFKYEEKISRGKNEVFY